MGAKIDKDRYTLKVSEDMLKECIRDLYLNPKKAIRKWSQITNQTAQGKFAYPSQHLASLITKVKGKGTAARGDDLADGSEVKSCSRADQLSECKDCGSGVLVWETKCGACGSLRIKRKTDSHWIFSIKSEYELKLLLDKTKIPRIILILFDNKEVGKDDIRLRAWVVDQSVQYVQDFFKNYFYENYQKKEEPAPCNLHPLKYDFYMMRPTLIFEANIDIKKNKVNIVFWNLDNPKKELMPFSILKKEQIKEVFGDIKLVDIQLIPEDKMDKLQMRKKILKKYNETYKRR